jgi:ribosomal protein S18 acetylase RimI-like enzyme
MVDHDVRPIVGTDVSRIAGVLADAFVDDPLSDWLFGGDEQLHERLRRSFQAILRHIYLPKAQSYTTTDLAGAAMWAPPGKWKISFLGQLKITPTFLRILPGRNLRRGAQVNTLLTRAHPAEAHWHLSVLGVDPVRQRTGVGSALLRRITQRADADRVLCYLETSKLDNVAYYVRHGFEVLQEFDAPDGGPHLWTMARRPL